MRVLTKTGTSRQAGLPIILDEPYASRSTRASGIEEERGRTELGLRINTNISAMNALRNLGATDEALGRSIERLSTGLRINRGSDDPAGLIHSESLRAQIRGLEQAVRNSQDAINMVKTAEAALNEVSTLLRASRNLAIHALNRGVVDDAQLRADQEQIRSTIQSINRIADVTAFSGKKLFDGTAGVSSAVVNSSDIAAINIGGLFGGYQVASGSITAALVTSATRATRTLTATYASLSSIVSAGTLVLNGYTIQSKGNETLQEIITKINDISNRTGVTAEVATANGSSVVRLVQTNYGSRYDFTLYDTSNLLMLSGTVTTAVGTDAVVSVSVLTSQGVVTSLFTGGQGSRDSGLRASDSHGNVIILTEAGNLGGLSGAGELVGALTAGTVSFQVGANAGEQARFNFIDLHADNLGTSAVPGKSFATIDLTTEQGAQDALKIIDAAIEQISILRGQLGSFQRDELESNVRSLTVARENLIATESIIRDADIATEITEFTKLQILSQSGMAVLAQANQAPQAILQLLR